MHMVAEAFGGWGLEEQKAFKVLGWAISNSSGSPHGAVVAQLYPTRQLKPLSRHSALPSRERKEKSELANLPFREFSFCTSTASRFSFCFFAL